MKTLLRLLAASQLLLFYAISGKAQSLVPFSNCPGVSVAITRPGFNATQTPYQIFLIDSAGSIQPSGNPINLQINGFGLNTIDGFLYGIHESSDVADPFLSRVDKNGNFENLGRLLAPPVDSFKVGIVNTVAGTMDDKDNFYFLAAVVNLDNIMSPPQLYVGRVAHISGLMQGSQPIAIKYTKIDPGTCLPELLMASTDFRNGALQDIAFNPANGNIYSYFPATATTPGTIAWFNPWSNPTFNCITPPMPNMATRDMCGLYFGNDSSLFILTIDGKFYKGNTNTGMISLVTQTSLPLLDGNLRGDMASCIGKKPLVPFENCPGASVAITRPGINSTDSPYQIFLIDKMGGIMASGSPIHHQINGFGLDNKDGFLYGMHESGDITGPFFSRVDRNGTVVDINRLAPPAAMSGKEGFINTVAGTMDGKDNFYFMAVVSDTPFMIINLPQLFLGKIKNVSKLHEGDSIKVTYKEFTIGGSCAADIAAVLSNPKNGLFQDISFDPENGNIYTTIPTSATLPAPAVIAFLRTKKKHPVLHCIEPDQPNPSIIDMCGLFSDQEGGLFILTIDGKFYKGNVHDGSISPVAQTTLPLLGNNLRGDMASCVSARGDDNNDDGDDEEDDDDEDSGNNRSHGDKDGTLRVMPNPVPGNQLTLSVTAKETSRAEMRVLSPNGSAVQSRTLNLTGGNNQVQVDISNLQKGVYSIVLVYSSGTTSVAKFVKL